MTDYEIEKQIRQMLEKFQQSDFTKNETRRCIAEVISHRLKEHINKTYDPNNRKKGESPAHGIEGKK